MKYSILLFFAFFIKISVSQVIEVSIKGNIVNSSIKEVELVSYTLQNKSYAVSSLGENGAFKMKATLPASDYYYFSVGNDKIPLILRDNSSLELYGDGSDIQNFCNILNSDESQQMLFFQREFNKWKKTLDSAELIIKADPSKQKEVSNNITPKYYSFKQFQQNYVSQNPNSAALFPLLKLYPINKDFQNYELLLMQLKKGFSISPTISKELNNYKIIKSKMASKNPLSIGNMAPDFREIGLDRKSEIKLSDFIGKVVLLDFWASWCAPCRRENPNLVALYNKYKEKGFTVLSVSLDSKLEKWKEAIKKDNLLWPNHVSDLGGWRSKVSKLYGVSSIPFTVLIDETGKIISTNLRGAVLDETLKNLFDK